MSNYEKQELLKASYKKLLRLAANRHQTTTRCSAQEAKAWIEGEVRIIKLEEYANNDRLISLDHSVANLIANVAMEAGFEPQEAKKFVLTKLPEHWRWFFKRLKIACWSSPNKTYRIGDLEFKEL